MTKSDEFQRISVQIYLLAMIDEQHLDTVFELHWLRVLTNSMSRLTKSRCC